MSIGADVYTLNHLAWDRFDDVPLRELQRQADERQIIFGVNRGDWSFSILTGDKWRRSESIYRSKRAALIAALLEADYVAEVA